MTKIVASFEKCEPDEVYKFFGRGFTPSDPHSLLGSAVNDRFGNRVKVSRKPGKLLFSLISKIKPGNLFFSVFFSVFVFSYSPFSVLSLGS